jgi:TolA-binding protein
MRKNLVFIVLIFISAHLLQAGDLDRAFKYINTGDYDKALQNIREELTDNPKNVAANYAMAKLYSSLDYKKYNLDSATIYINKSYAAIPVNTEDKMGKKYLKLGVRDFTIKELFDEINKTAYDKAKSVNSFESYDHFLNYSKDPALNTSATDKRDEIRFAEIKIRDDFQALKDFLNNYPKSKKYEEANTLYEKMLYDQMTKPDSYESYKAYLDKYPTGPYVKDAKAKYDERLYQSYIKKNKLEDYNEFEKSYPKSPYRGAVQDSIYSLSTASHSTADYNAFIKTYPSNKNIMDAWNRLFDIYTQNATDSEYAFFQKIYPNNPLGERIRQEQYLSKLSLAPYKSNDKYGYVNTATQVLSIEPQYYDAGDFSDGLASVAVKPCSDSCYYSYIDKSGKVAIESSYTAAGDFDKGKAIVAISYCDGDPCQYGIINKRNEFLVNPIYQDIQPASEGLFSAHNAKGYGFIDETGKTIIPFIYQDATGFSEGSAGVKKDSSWIYIDRSGQQIFTQKFKNITAFSSGLAAVTTDDSTYGYINKSGSWAIDPTFEFAEPFEGDTAIVTVKDTNRKSKDYELSFRYKIDKTGQKSYKLTNPNAAAKTQNGRKKKKR